MQIQVLTVLARTKHMPLLSRLTLEGRVREAVVRAEDLILAHRGDALPIDDALSETAQLCGDLMLALDRPEEAEEIYRIAVRCVGTARRGAVRIVSCRSTGFMSLHRQRFGTAIACFSRLVADEAATAAQRVEALCALSAVRHVLGQKTVAVQSLLEASTLARNCGDADLIALTDLVRLEMAVRGEIRDHELLRDHVFWTPSPSNPQLATEEEPPLVAIERLLDSLGQHVLIAQRLRHLRDLLRAARGAPALQDALESHLAWLRGVGLATLEQQARVDTALAAITQRQHDFARSVIEPMTAGTTDSRRRWGMELSYCQAKLSMVGGRSEEAMRHYQRYALESIERVRAASATASPSAPMPAPRPADGCPAEVKDDIEMRLPAKYRRAYRYMQTHLGSAELSVREIADGTGVSERALQWAFKAYLGMTPAEVVQRCRVERIRSDLLRDDVLANITETAARWGIRNRSTLITSYRKYFRETPTQTIARRGVHEAVVHS